MEINDLINEREKLKARLANLKQFLGKKHETLSKKVESKQNVVMADSKRPVVKSDRTISLENQLDEINKRIAKLEQERKAFKDTLPLNAEDTISTELTKLKQAIAEKEGQLQRLEQNFAGNIVKIAELEKKLDNKEK